MRLGKERAQAEDRALCLQQTLLMDPGQMRLHFTFCLSVADIINQP